jgi:hypothetical protein
VEPTLPDLSQLDRAALQALLLAEHQELIATHRQLHRREIEIENLKLLLSQQQLELRLEDLQQAEAAEQASSEAPSPSPESAPATTRQNWPAGQSIHSKFPYSFDIVLSARLCEIRFLIFR